MIYLHVMEDQTDQILSPLDALGASNEHRRDVPEGHFTCVTERDGSPPSPILE